MEHTSVNIGTININTITNTTKLNALRTFLRTTDLDIVFLQEVENEQLALPGYNVVCNVDQARRGTAIALKTHIKFSHVEKSLDGRLLALRVHNTTMCNVYAPSGSALRAERERFFNNTIAYYLRYRTDHVILGGDFNCVVRQCDATGSNPSPALQATIQQLRMHDVWLQLRSREPGYTFITHNSSSRLDRLYVSANLREQLRATDIHVCCFSDHKAVTARICIPLPDRAPGRGFWSLRPHLLSTDNLEELQTQWQYWTRQRRYYRSWMEWWLSCAKSKLKSFFKWKSKIAFDAFYREQQRLYGLLQRAYDSYHHDRSMLVTINRVKAEMLAHQRRFTEMFLHINETYVAGEAMSTYQLGERTRRKTMIEHIRNERDEVIDDADGIRDHMVEYFTNLYARGDVDDLQGSGFQCERAIPEQDHANTSCMSEITTVEILSAIRTSASRKSPGPDGLPKEFYLRTFDVIHRELNLVLNEAISSNLPTTFLDGVIVLVKKRGAGDTARAYRPISLINYDYKILARILKTRLESVMLAHNVLTDSQKCSNGRRNIFQATLAVKHRIAQLKSNRQCGKLIGFDLDHAFDRVDHGFLFNTMRGLGFNTALVDLLSRIAAASSSRLLINGSLSATFPIQRSVRQGDPLSMHLFVIYLHPLLRRLKQVCGRDLIVAYADDISAIVTSVEQLNAMRNLFRGFGRVSGAVLNENKTTAIDVGIINASLTVPWLRTDNTIKILGIVFTNSIREMVTLNWDTIVTNFSRQVWLHSQRALTLYQKVILFNTFLSSKMWYMAAHLPPLAEHVAKLTSTMRRYLFRGAPATIPMLQLARRKQDGGMNLHLPSMKCNSLIINRHLTEIDSLPFYQSCINQVNPIPANVISNLPCLKLIISHLPNLPFQIRVHPSADLIHRLFVNQTDRPKVESDHPNCNWSRVWLNISTRELLSPQKSALYMWVNQKVPCRWLLFRMRRTDGEHCLHCAAPSETMEHKFFNCSRVQGAWRLLQRRLLEMTGRRRPFVCTELLRPSLEWTSAADKIMILKTLVNYFTFIESSNGRIDVDALKFHLDVEV